MSEQNFTVEAADYHRNGISGEGFHVAIVNDEDHGGRMLVIDFTGASENGDYGYTAVLNLDKANEGNIYMHPEPGKPGTGGNAWRGDRLGDRYREAIKAEVQAGYDRLLASITPRTSSKED